MANMMNDRSEHVLVAVKDGAVQMLRLNRQEAALSILDWLAELGYKVKLVNDPAKVGQ